MAENPILSIYFRRIVLCKLMGEVPMGCGGLFPLIGAWTTLCKACAASYMLRLGPWHWRNGRRFSKDWNWSKDSTGVGTSQCCDIQNLVPVSFFKICTRKSWRFKVLMDARKEGAHKWGWACPGQWPKTWWKWRSMPSMQPRCVF